MKLTFYGHAAWHVKTGDTDIWMDPFLSNNPGADVDPEKVDADYIIVTHGHFDHMGDTEAIASRTGATTIAMNEIANFMGDKGYAAEGVQIGGGQNFPFGRVKMTLALHSSSLGGSYMGSETGVLLYDKDGTTLYHAGDTGLFSDMELIGKEGVDVALIPIGDKYTMGPDDALTAVELIRPKVAIPMHYNTFEAIAQDPEAWKSRVEEATDTTVVVMKPGEEYQVS